MRKAATHAWLGDHQRSCCDSGVIWPKVKSSEPCVPGACTNWHIRHVLDGTFYDFAGEAFKGLAVGQTAPRRLGRLMIRTLVVAHIGVGA